MDEMNDFENRMSEDARSVAGPPRPVDVDAVLAGIHSTRSPLSSIRLMFSATQVAVAAMVLMLVGGFLFASLGGQPNTTESPAAATTTPTAMPIASFTATAELVAKLETEEVEPGVLRVLDDGHIDDGRGIERPAEGFPSVFVEVRPDGEVWLSGGGGRGDLFQLGEAGSYEDAASGPAAGSGRLEVGPDGAFWAHGEGIVRRFVDGVWTSWQLEDGLETAAITVDEDGAPWVLALQETWSTARIVEENPAAYRLLTLTPTGTWMQIEVPFDLGNDNDWRWLEAAPDGSLWLSGGQVRAPDGARTLAMVRFDGVEWELVDVPGADSDFHGLGIGPDGELWREFVDPVARLDLDPDPEREDLRGLWIGLARLDEEGWTTFGAAEGVGSWGQLIGMFFATDLLEVGPDGTVWVNASRHALDCGGVAGFDGATWKPYLEGQCVHDLAVAPDGALWVRAFVDGWEGRVGTYVIPATE